jgi:excisionase family DNA binding protein
MNKEHLLTTVDSWLTTSAVARLVDRTADTVRHWHRIGLLPAMRTESGQRLFRRADVEALLERRAQEREEAACA